MRTVEHARFAVAYHTSLPPQPQISTRAPDMRQVANSLVSRAKSEVGGQPQYVIPTDVQHCDV